MAGRKKHMERSKYSYHNQVDYSGFHRKAGIKTAKKVNESLVSSLLGMFKRQKKGDK